MCGDYRGFLRQGFEPQKSDANLRVIGSGPTLQIFSLRVNSYNAKKTSIVPASWLIGNFPNES